MVAISNLIHYETLLQNATDIIAKSKAILLQSTRKSLYYKMRQFFIIKCDSHYKMR